MIDATKTAMKRRDDGGEAMVQAKKKGPDCVDKAPDHMKEALRRGDINSASCIKLVKHLLKGGVSFTISDQRCGSLVPHNLASDGIAASSFWAVGCPACLCIL